MGRESAGSSPSWSAGGAATPEWTARIWIESSCLWHAWSAAECGRHLPRDKEGAMPPTNSIGPVLWSVDPRGVASVVLNRPDANSAYDGDIIQGVHAASDALAGADHPRAIVVNGNCR